jgi:hypothetical protein
MADAHRRHFDAVLVWKIDRYGRSLKHLVNALADLLFLWNRFHQLPRQPWSQYALWSPDVSDHRGHGRVRAITHSGAGKGRSAECTRERQEVRKATRASGCFARGSAAPRRTFVVPGMSNAQREQGERSAIGRTPCRKAEQSLIGPGKSCRPAARDWLGSGITCDMALNR